jgi:hypothetical protein
MNASDIKHEATAAQEDRVVRHLDDGEPSFRAPVRLPEDVARPENSRPSGPENLASFQFA